MANEPFPSAASEISAERKMLKRSLTLLPLFGIIYFTVSGGTFGIEPLFSYSGAGMALLLICVIPFVYSLPYILMVRELQSMMPVEGSYYYWTKEAFGPFPGFLVAWMDWVLTLVDVAIYPVLAVTYLSFWVPQLTEGGWGMPGWVVQWFAAIAIILIISLLQIRGVRLAGMTSVWIGVFLLIPIAIMTVLGFYNWGAHGSTFDMTFLPKDTRCGAPSVSACSWSCGTTWAGSRRPPLVTRSSSLDAPTPWQWPWCSSPESRPMPFRRSPPSTGAPGRTTR